MTRIAGFLVLTTLASACNNSKQPATEANVDDPTAEAPPAPGATLVSTQTSQDQEQQAAEPKETASAKLADARKSEVDSAEVDGAEVDAVREGAPPSEPASPEKPKAKPAPEAPQPTTEQPTTKQPTTKQKVVFGPVVKGEGYAVRLQTKSPLKTGESAALTVVLTAEAPFKCNDKYPYKFTFDPVDGVSFPNQVVKGMNVSDKRATMLVPFSPKGPGDQTVSGTLSFSVCTDDKCLVEKQPLTIAFNVHDS